MASVVGFFCCLSFLVLLLSTAVMAESYFSRIVSFHDPLAHVGITVGSLAIFALALLTLSFLDLEPLRKSAGSLQAYAKFCWNCFIKPHATNSANQQDALESFYKAQADVYDKTRAKLLSGREDMLGLVAAQVKNASEAKPNSQKPIWVDIGGGTGWNIEKMNDFVSVPDFFHAVYLVDLSTSLCEVARQRFAALGWKNVRVICEDARSFDLSKYEDGYVSRSYGDDEEEKGCVDVLTMSYSLSMIPDYYSVVDSLTSLLSPEGVIGVVDFYVQNQADLQGRNYIGGLMNRHCTWLSRTFWRTWFELDRVNLEGARRDFLEYRFGTILSINQRNTFLGFRIPYYIWVGCSKDRGSSEKRLAEIDAAATESPFLSALDLKTGRDSPVSRPVQDVEYRSKGFENAIVNLSRQLPLPAAWYQNHHWRIYYDDKLQKHRQFNDEYIYAFTWEDSRVDARLLNINSDDTILAITSAGDNILAYATHKPRRIHAVDLNPTQNHLLELKVAAFSSLSYQEVWKLFGEGTHADFRSLLINKLSPHMSSVAVQYWLQEGPKTFSQDKGLYFTGGSRHALVLLRWLFRLFRMQGDVKQLCEAQTLNEQKEVWRKRVRGVVLSQWMSWFIVSNEKWLWKALGVPPNQRMLIEQDYVNQSDAADEDETPHTRSGHAIWEYAVNTLDPVINASLLSDDNSYYLLCLQGRYSRKCHPEYLTPKAHIKLSHQAAFDGLRIHTDELFEVISRMTPRSLTIAVVMDSMDWFDPAGDAAALQVKMLNRALKKNGRVLLRSSGLAPWYLKVFEDYGFSPRRVGCRMPGTCIDRVNMYASTWICTKMHDWVDPAASSKASRGSPVLAPLSLGLAATPE